MAKSRSLQLCNNSGEVLKTKLTKENNVQNLKRHHFKLKKLTKPIKPHIVQLATTLSPNGNKRSVIIDGCNVGFAHANHRHFSVEGMETCINHFTNLGHPTIAVVPERRRHSNNNPRLLQQLNNSKKVLFAPFDNEYGKCAETYDDKCILALAANYDGVVISNDNYRDCIHQNNAWREVIENRVIPFCYFKDMFIIPRDPYGPNRPTLEKILNK